MKNKNITLIISLAVFMCSNGSLKFIDSSEFKHDFSTPQGTILTLEDAYRENNIEKVILCKNFTEEAKLMVKENQKLQNAISNDSLLNEVAMTLQLAYRKEIRDNGFPNLSEIIKIEYAILNSNLNSCVLVERCTYRDNAKVDQNILLTKDNKNQWKMAHAIN